MGWLIMWGVVTWAASELWLWLCWDTYTPQQQMTIKATKWQNRTVAVLMWGVGCTLFLAGAVGGSGGLMGNTCVYLVPLATFWISVERRVDWIDWRNDQRRSKTF